MVIYGCGNYPVWELSYSPVVNKKIEFEADPDLQTSKSQTMRRFVKLWDIIWDPDGNDDDDTGLQFMGVF